MAGKHQIWSSNKKTRQKARRCWRRQDKLRLQGDISKDESQGQPAGLHNEDPRRGGLVYSTDRHFGTDLGKLIDESLSESMRTQIDDFNKLVQRWAGCGIDVFEKVLVVPEEQVADEYQRFRATPLDYFLSLDRERQARFIQFLKNKSD